MLQPRPPQLVTPYLPTAWHSSVTRCLKDLCTISALFDMPLGTDIDERRDAQIRFKVGMQQPAPPEPESLIERVTARCRDAVPFICIQCGSSARCAKVGRWFYCGEHFKNPTSEIHRSDLAQIRSPWHVEGAPMSALERMTVQDAAMHATSSLARRYNSATVSQLFAQAQSRRARQAMDQVTQSIQIAS